MSQDGYGTAGLTGDEFDRLADYLADVLDPAETAEVGRLIAGDARWATAHAELTIADQAVRTLLSGPVAAVGPMPADVAARLDDAIRAVGSTARGLELVPDPAITSAAITSAAGTPTVISLTAARARRRRLATRLAAVAAAVAVITGGITVLSNLTTIRAGTATSAAGDAAGAPERGESALPPAVPGLPGYLASGTNYTRDTLARLTQVRGAPAATGSYVAAPQAVNKDGGVPPMAVRDDAPGSLTRLLDQANLAACLQSIQGGFPGTVTTIDYARFDGSPALVVVIQRSGGSVVVAAGPDCGLAGPDIQGSAQVP